MSEDARPGRTYTDDAVDALLRALPAEADFGGWLANVLATVAARCENGTDALTASRPGSWEASHVERLADGGVVLERD